MHICTAYIMLGGDHGSVVYRGPDNPVSWPEVGVLQVLHGEESVFNIEVIDELTRHRSAEKLRLQRLYGDQIVEAIYPGRSPTIEMQVPGYEPKNGPKVPRRDPDADENEPEDPAEYEDTDLDPDPIDAEDEDDDSDQAKIAQANFEAMAASKTRPPRNKTKGAKGVLVTAGGQRIPLGEE
jgi:hypothetical protein